MWSSQGKSLVDGTGSKKIDVNGKKIHCHLRNGYFVTVNQSMIRYLKYDVPVIIVSPFPHIIVQSYVKLSRYYTAIWRAIRIETIITKYINYVNLYCIQIQVYVTFQLVIQFVCFYFCFRFFFFFFNFRHSQNLICINNRYVFNTET